MTLTNSAEIVTSDRIVDSAITVIARDGLDALSIRRVAAETGVAIGTVQYHHPSRAEVVLAALQRTAHRQQVRVMTAPREPTITATLIARLALLLPHDDASREEAIVWVALAAAAARDPLVGPHQRQLVKQTVAGIAALLDRAVQSGELPDTVDTFDLAERTHVVAEGYLLHTAASGSVTTGRTGQQFRATLTALFAHNVTR
jgi:AcrR family transcriptional regulator